MDHPRAIGASLANTESVLARHRQLVMLVALRVDAAPLGHAGHRLGVSVDRPRSTVAVRLTLLAALLDMRQHIKVELLVVIEHAFAGRHIVVEGFGYELWIDQ